MRKLTVAVIVAGTAGALAWPPSRQVIGEWLITAGVALAFGPPPPMTPAQVAAGEQRLRAEAVKAAKGERERERHDTNGRCPSQPI